MSKSNYIVICSDNTNRIDLTLGKCYTVSKYDFESDLGEYYVKNDLNQYCLYKKERFTDIKVYRCIKINKIFKNIIFKMNGDK